MSKKILLTVAFATFASTLLLAQGYQGGVRGAISDSSGAAVASAKITLTDIGTTVARSTLSNAEGSYAFSALDPATYTLSAEAPGFKKIERKNVIVGTQQYLSIDLKLEPGSIVESVLVTAEVPLIENAKASNGQVLDLQKMVDLPNLGLNPF